MAWVAASLLVHRGHGPRHADLVLGTGPRCVTIRMEISAGRWRVGVGVAHRRRYLTYRGPVVGRGTVAQLWRGRGWSSRSANAQHFRLWSNQMDWMKMRRFFGMAEGVRAAFPWGRGEVVVPLHRVATLPRS